MPVEPAFERGILLHNECSALGVSGCNAACTLLTQGETLNEN
jgi:hypothetical protein